MCSKKRRRTSATWNRRIVLDAGVGSSLVRLTRMPDDRSSSVQLSGSGVVKWVGETA